MCARERERAQPGTAVEQMWHMQDSHGQILALALRQKSLQRLKLFPLRSEAAGPWTPPQMERLQPGDTTVAEDRSQPYLTARGPDGEEDVGDLRIDEGRYLRLFVAAPSLRGRST